MDETLNLYLVVLKVAVSVVLIHIESKRELLVFCIIRALLDLETRYPDSEKISLALVVAA